MPRTKQFDEQEVLTRAMDLFWRQGYTATSVQDLVDHLGINRASMYDTFGGKETLFKKALEHYRKTNREGVRQFFQNHPDVKEGIRQLFEKAIDDSVNDNYRKGCFVVNTTTELIPGDDQILKVLEENKKQFERIFYEYLKKGEGEGQFNTDQNLKSVASLLFTLYNGIKVVSKIQPDRTELMNSVKVVLSLLR